MMIDDKLRFNMQLNGVPVNHAKLIIAVLEGFSVSARDLVNAGGDLKSLDAANVCDHFAGQMKELVSLAESSPDDYLYSIGSKEKQQEEAISDE